MSKPGAPNNQQYTKMPNPQSVAAKVIQDGRVLEQTVTTTLTAVDKPKDDDSIKGWWIELDDPGRTFVDSVPRKPTKPDVAGTYGPGRFIIVPLDSGGIPMRDREEQMSIIGPQTQGVVMNNGYRPLTNFGQQSNQQIPTHNSNSPIIIQPPQPPTPPAQSEMGSDFMRMMMANKAAEEDRKERELAERKRIDEEHRKEEDRKKAEKEEERKREDKQKEEERKREDAKREDERLREEKKREDERLREEKKREDEKSRLERISEEEKSHNRKLEVLRVELEAKKLEDERKREEKEALIRIEQNKKDDELKRLLLERENDRKAEQQRRDEEYRRDREEREDKYRRDKEDREERDRKDRDKRDEQERKDKLAKEENDRKEREERDRREKEERKRYEDEIARREEKIRQDKKDQRDLMMHIGGIILPVILPVIADRLKKDEPIEPPPPYIPTPQQDNTPVLMHMIERLEDKLESRDNRGSQEDIDDRSPPSSTEESMQILRMGMELGRGSVPKEEKKEDLLDKIVALAPVLMPMMANMKLGAAQAQQTQQVNPNHQIAQQNQHLMLQQQQLIQANQQLAAQAQSQNNRLQSAREVQSHTQKKKPSRDELDESMDASDRDIKTSQQVAAQANNNNVTVNSAGEKVNSSGEKVYTESEVQQLFSSSFDQILTNPDTMAAVIKRDPHKYGPAVMELVTKHGSELMMAMNTPVQFQQEQTQNPDPMIEATNNEQSVQDHNQREDIQNPDDGKV
jgi:hypothetical protein